MSKATYDNPDACYWNGSMGPFLVGIVGIGPGLRVLLNIISNDAFREFVPDMKLVAMSDADAGEARRHLRDFDIPLYPTFREMLRAHPEVNLIVEMNGRAGLLEQLRTSISPSVSIIDHREVVFFCGLHDMAIVKGYCRDNLAHQQTLMKSIMDEIQEDVILMNKAGEIVDLNRNVWERSGIPREELLGKPCWHAARLRDGSGFCDHFDEVCPFHKTLKSGQKEETLVTRVNRDGLLQYYRLYSYPIFDMTGTMSHIMVMHRDITKRTLREKHQHQRDKLAVIGEMSTYLAHEIRNPLFAIGGFANSLLRSPDITPKDKEKVEIVVEETKRLDRMLTSMLTFTKHSKAAEQAVDMLAVSRSAAELMRIGYSRHGYSITVDSGPNLPTVWGNEDALKQCVINLVKNAVEAMPDGGTVALRLDLEDQYVVLRVTDTGVGMTEAEQERAFSPFYSTKEEGSGLGLAMIKKIVEEHAGRVELASIPGRGTTVSLYLPPSLDVGTGPVTPPC
jgi:PAS domain S-box-containing protein